jgi:multiple sugar transport system substrate-binding protein
MITLRGMTWNHPRGVDPLVSHAHTFAAKHNIDITWDARTLEDFEEFPLDQLAAKYDLMVIDHPHVGMAAASGCLLPLDGIGRDDELAMLHGNTVGSANESYHYHGRQWALAIDAAAQVAARRVGSISDWPQSWPKVVELARHGHVLCPMAPVHTFTSFLAHCANIGHPCCDGGEVLVDPEIGRAVLERLCDFAALLPKFCFSLNPIGVLDRMSADERYAYSPLVFGYANYSRDGFRHTPLEFGEMPGLTANNHKGSTLGGTGIAVSARSAHRDAAIDIAFDLARAHTQRTIYAAAGGQPAHREAWNDPAVNAASRNFFANTITTLELAHTRPRFNGYVAYQSAAGRFISDCLRGQSSAAATVANLNEQFAKAQKKS